MTDTDGNGHEEREEPERPIVLMRSAPVELHFWNQGQDEASGRVRIATYLRTGLLARTTMDAEQFYVLRRSNAAREPVRITGLACYSGPGEALLLMLQVEAREDLWLFESEPLEFKLGVRHRTEDQLQFPGNLEREARDFFGSILQGRPDAAIERLFEAARREAVLRHEARLQSGGHEPGRDIAETVWSNRIRSEEDA